MNVSRNSVLVKVIFKTFQNSKLILHRTCFPTINASLINVFRARTGLSYPVKRISIYAFGLICMKLFDDYALRASHEFLY